MSISERNFDALFVFESDLSASYVFRCDLWLVLCCAAAVGNSSYLVGNPTALFTEEGLVMLVFVKVC